MKFPLMLLQKNRKCLSSNRINNWNYLYTRHKPSYDWDESEGLPDFTKLKIDQSYNWCNFSIPIWTRFNNNKQYLSDYAVAGFKVKTIRNVYKYMNDFDSPITEVHHKPVPNNYSHCELLLLENINKMQKREMRINFRHSCIVPLKPDEKRFFLLILFDMVKMLIRRFISGNSQEIAI